MQLEGATAVVTGASTGIGHATAVKLGRAGMVVVLASRSAARLHDVARTITDAGGTALAIPTDITDQGQVQHLVDTTVQECGGIDLLVNNAGIGTWDDPVFVEADLDGWVREVEVNLLGLMQVTRLAAPHLRDGGLVVNVSSGADRGFSGEYPAYVTSKWGVRGFSGSARLGLRDRGIRVTTLSPGEVDTAMQPEGESDRMRMLDPEDVADAILFVASRPRHVSVPEMVIAPSRLDS